MTAPSTTDRGRAWIANFLPEDQAVAAFLLDSVTFVPSSVVFAESKALLERLVAEERLPTPALLVPTRSVEDIDGQSRSAQQGSPVSPPVAYIDYMPAQRIPALAGSEAFIGNLIRDLAVLGPERQHWVAPEAALDDLRVQQVRSIVLVTDYAGSGQQLAALATAFVRNPTIRSWRSGRFVRIVAFAYALSDQAAHRIAAAGSPIDEMQHVAIAPSIATAGWTRAQRQQVEALCVRYARKKSQALGYQGSGGLYATSLSVPNNLPVILRQSHPGWSPFFAGRTVPSDLASAVGEHTPRVSHVAAVERIGQPRLARTLTDYRRAENRELLLVLGAISRGVRRPLQLASQLGLERSRVRVLVEALRSLDLIEPAGHVTADGEAALADARRAMRRSLATLESSDVSYYPSSLR